MSSTWGEKLNISIFGESHSQGIGVVIQGLPAGEAIDMDEVLVDMKRRAPGSDKTGTTRKEGDVPKIMSGFLDGKLEGSPLCAVIENTNTKSGDYSNILNSPRPGHSDFAAFVRYNGANDIRGGGHFSGRLTAPLVFAGSVARQILRKKGIVIAAHALEVAGVLDDSFDSVNPDVNMLERLNKNFFSVISKESEEKMREEIEKARLDGDSVGGIIECIITGVPAGLGDPMFSGIENKIASIIFGVPAVKGIEFGSGFDSTRLRGSQNNDDFYMENGTIKTETNHSGGILGGISSGMPILFKVGIKPTPSISRPQNTVNLVENKNETLEIKGRHDPCIVPRAIPVIECAAALALLDIML